MTQLKKLYLKLLSAVRKIKLPLLLITLQTWVLYLQPLRLTGDDPIRFNAVTEILNGTMPAMKFSIIHPEFFAIIQKILDALSIGAMSASHSGAILWALWSISIALILRAHRSERYIVYALSFVYFSMLGAYLTGFSSDVFSALGISLGLAMAILAKGYFIKITGLFFLVFSTANTPVLLAGAVTSSLFMIIKLKQLRYALYPMLTLLLIIAEASFFRGQLAISKYALGTEGGRSILLPWGYIEGFKYPVFFGVISILFSFGRGFLFYIPSFLVALRRYKDLLGNWITVQLLFVLSLIPIYGAWWAWYGGLSYGPRFFMLGCIVGAFGVTEILFGHVKHKLTTKIFASLSILMSFWVSFIGISYFITPKVAFMCMKEGFRYEPLCWYSPEYSTIFAPLWEGGAVSNEAKYFTYLGSLILALIIVERFLPHAKKKIRRLFEEKNQFLRDWKF